MEEKTPIEEIAAEEIEVINSRDDETVTRISADDRHPNMENPFEKLTSTITEFKKIRFFGPLAFFLSLIGIAVYPLYLEPVAIALAGLDIWKGSKLTRKLSYFAIGIAALALLNLWA